MGLRIVVLAKQVPDTKKVTGKAMKDDGTVNRQALPAIFNPEDLNALEMALQLKDEFGAHVSIVTMGPPSAGEILRAALYRGADEAILLTDRRAAASDTLATSYILSCAVKKLSPFDLVLCGRQAIDGDTAQVGPQTAEKLGITQITYVENISEFSDGKITVKRNTDNGYEIVRSKLPALFTVMDTANEPRPVSVKKLMKYKKSKAPAEVLSAVEDELPEASPEERQKVADERIKKMKEKGYLLTQWNLDDIDADIERCGKSGSPTKVKRIQSIVLTASEVKSVEPTDEGLEGLVHELIEDHTIG